MTGLTGVAASWYFALEKGLVGLDEISWEEMGLALAYAEGLDKRYEDKRRREKRMRGSNAATKAGGSDRLRAMFPGVFADKK